MTQTRRQLLAFATGAGLGVIAGIGLKFLFPSFRSEPPSWRRPFPVEIPQLEIAVSKRYANLRILEDLIGQDSVCLIPKNPDDKEAIAKFKAEQEKFYITTRASLIGDSEKLSYFALYINYAGDKGEVTPPGAQIIGVTDLRGISGISEAYFESRAPVSHLLKYGAATNKIPMHVYLTETAADRLRDSSLFRQNLMAHLSPYHPATVLPDDSEQAKFIRNEPCKTGIHEFFPKQPINKWRFDDRILKP